jgi:hypothetical protein
VRNQLFGRRQARASRHRQARLAGLAAAAAVTAVLLSAIVTPPAGPGTAAARGPASSAPITASTADAAISEAGARAPADVPYSLPVRLPAMSASPPVAAGAPYTPEVLNLIAPRAVSSW